MEAVYQRNPEIMVELDRQGLRPANLRHTGILIETLPTLKYDGVEIPQQFAQQLAVKQVESKKEATVSQELEAQYKSKRAKADAGQRAVKTAERFKEQVNHFVKWIGAQFPINSITSQTLIDYHAILLGELTRGRRTAGAQKINSRTSYTLSGQPSIGNHSETCRD